MVGEKVAAHQAVFNTHSEVSWNFANSICLSTSDIVGVRGYRRSQPLSFIIASSGRLRVSVKGVREAILDELGFSVASEWLFAPELKSEAVTSVLGDWPLPPVDLWAVLPAGRQACAKARAFADFIQSQMTNTKLTVKASEQISDDGLSGRGLSMGRAQTESTNTAGGTHCSELAAAA